jgi:DNA-binding MarR family transcriptional regulator
MNEHEVREFNRIVQAFAESIAKEIGALNLGLISPTTRHRTGKRETEIINFLKKTSKALSISEVATHFGIQHASASIHLKKLADKKMITRTPVGGGELRFSALPESIIVP